MESVKRRKSERVKEWFFGKNSRSSSSKSSHKSSTTTSLEDHTEKKCSDAASIDSTCQAQSGFISDISVRSPKSIEQAVHNEAHDADPPAYTPAPGQDLWEMARIQLNAQDQKVLEENVHLDPTRDILRQVQGLVAEKQRLVGEKMWKLDFGGRRIVLRDVVAKISGWIKTFKDVGDTITSFDPAHFALPWAAISVVLTITTADVEQTGQILIGIEQVTCLISRCRIYEMLYIKPDSSTSMDAIDELRKSVVQLYKGTLSFMIFYIQRLEKNTAMKALGATFNPGKLNDMLGDLGKYETRCEAAANNCERHVSSLARVRQDAAQNQLQEILKKHIRNVDANTNRYWKRLEDDERCKIFQWISEVPFETDHYNASKGRVEGTGQWLLEHAAYREWRVKETSTILWLNGIPGAGKTKLSSKVIDDIFHQTTDGHANEAFAYFYCDRNRTDHRDPVVVLRSLVRQFSAPKDESTIIPYIEAKYTERKRAGFSRDQLTSEECQELLLQLTREYAVHNIVIDGLDECDRDTRCILMDALDLLAESSSHPVKIYIASRQDQDLRDRYENRDHLEVTANDNQADIEKFVLSKLEQSPFCRTKMSKHVRKEILHTFYEKSQGMFQWAALHIGELLKLNRNKDILGYLDKLPRGLEAAYHKVYHEIASQPNGKQNVAFAAFKILMCSWRPLSPEEMVIAATQDVDDDFCIEQDVDIDYVLDACHNFMVISDGLPERGRGLQEETETDTIEIVVVEQSYMSTPSSRYRLRPILDGPETAVPKTNTICRFAHLSVREYLELHQWSIAEANAYMACICLRTLLRLQWGDNPLEPDGEHAYRSIELEDEENDIMTHPWLGVSVVEQYTRNELIWFPMWGELETDQNQEPDPRDENPEFDPPPFKCILELCNLHTHDDASVCSSVPYETRIEHHDGTALEKWTYYAAETWSLHAKNATVGKIERARVDALLVKFLGGPKSSTSAYRAWTILSRGRTNRTLDQPEHSKSLATLDRQSPTFHFEHPELLHFLYDRFPRTLLRPTDDPTLGCALFGLGHILDQWLETGQVDANHTNARGDSLLLLAIQGHHSGVCEVLLSRGADPSAMAPEGYSPLQAAVMNHQPETVRLLLDHGADPNQVPGWKAQGYFANYPLDLAVSFGQYECTKILIERGANALRDEVIENSATGGDIRTTRLLLDSLSETENTTEDDGLKTKIKTGIENAWKEAMKNENINKNTGVLSVFLDRNIDMAENDSIHIATEFERMEIVRWLMGQGLDINQKSRQGVYGDTPLLAVVRDSTPAVATVQWLITNGANIDAIDKVGYTALHLTLLAGHASAAKYLLEIGADVSTKSRSGITVLTTACMNCPQDVVSKLLDLGLDVNECAGSEANYKFPLLAAYTRYNSWPKTREIMCLLLEAGAKFRLDDFTEQQIEAIGASRLQKLERLARDLWPCLWKKETFNIVPWRVEGSPEGPMPALLEEEEGDGEELYNMESTRWTRPGLFYMGDEDDVRTIVVPPEF